MADPKGMMPYGPMFPFSEQSFALYLLANPRARRPKPAVQPYPWMPTEATPTVISAGRRAAQSSRASLVPWTNLVDATFMPRMIAQ